MFRFCVRPELLNSTCEAYWGREMALLPCSAALLRGDGIIGVSGRCHRRSHVTLDMFFSLSVQFGGDHSKLQTVLFMSRLSASFSFYIILPVDTSNCFEKETQINHSLITERLWQRCHEDKVERVWFSLASVCHNVLHAQNEGLTFQLMSSLWMFLLTIVVELLLTALLEIPRLYVSTSCVLVITRHNAVLTFLLGLGTEKNLIEVRKTSWYS